ncbi:cell-envelope stress modulator CpxP [Pectobacteriaceae bacterium CE90]|nr:cell-envelope stress modulator CpxP [Prodigiosinella sp. LS101]WJV53770.1 cell-envelope stress modulator CpxP [Prodigiosinella sp. LS101]WJV58131.1 cell-envelope stress modulator CpxP [Pectobacteriaceae bacterium C111]WJY15249.1 cell-envelope stress modulator CpxP [Pectobacteriaceae bacterium CE90]
MRRVATLSLASLLMLGSGIIVTAAAESLPMGDWHYDESAMKCDQSQQSMFDGVTLTEHQRQQMRDLMQQVRHGTPSYDVGDMEDMHRLVVAKNFDTSAVKALVSKMVHMQIARRVEIARVCNQMYNLLTPEQKETLDQEHQQYMQKIQQQMSMMNQNAQNFSLSK